jgi:hypothetical protein
MIVLEMRHRVDLTLESITLLCGKIRLRENLDRVIFVGLGVRPFADM